jgi:tryptophan-rich sensory protein
VDHGELQDQLEQPVAVGEVGAHAADPNDLQNRLVPVSERLAAAAGPLAAAVLGGLATDPDSSWFHRLDKPSWYPPPQTFGVVWTALYSGTAWAAGEVLTRSDGDARRSFARAYAINLALNTGWTPLFFRAHRPGWAAVESAVLTGSTVDLVRRAARVSAPAAAVLAPYAAWTAFATVLSAAIARRNRS